MKIALKELGEIITGNTPSKKNDEFYSSRDIAFVKPDIISDKFITEMNEVDEYISENARSKARIVSKGAILVTCIGSIGKIGIISDGEYAFNQQINAIIPIEANQKYLAYNLLYNKSRLIDIANAPVVPIINKTQFGDFEILYCSNKKIQQDIVYQLDCIMSVIDKRQKQLKYLDELVKARFVEMFGNPISNPMGWNMVTFNDCLINIENGKSFVCDSYARVGEQPAILKLSSVTYGVYKPEENKAIINEEDFVNSAEVHGGDLLFTRKNTPELVGMSAYVVATPAKLMMPDLIFRLNTNESCNKIFLWKLINHELYRSQIENAASGSAKSMSNISKERLGKLSIALPPIELQNKFANFVQQVEKSRTAIKKSLEETQILFDSLMQKYFA